ncbi:MAG TPA: hypothetical protein DD435_07945 [Cyanobacteria bacterium UBA8530]|nr:hypothetical protein [Cyanobacteria bacterium UBA8530]
MRFFPFSRVVRMALQFFLAFAVLFSAGGLHLCQPEEMDRPPCISTHRPQFGLQTETSDHGSCDCLCHHLRTPFRQAESPEHSFKSAAPAPLHEAENVSLSHYAASIFKPPKG